jgi:hypothetical protein
VCVSTVNTGRRIIVCASAAVASWTYEFNIVALVRLSARAWVTTANAFSKLPFSFPRWPSANIFLVRMGRKTRVLFCCPLLLSFLLFFFFIRGFRPSFPKVSVSCTVPNNHTDYFTPSPEQSPKRSILQKDLYYSSFSKLIQFWFATWSSRHLVKKSVEGRLSRDIERNSITINALRFVVQTGP